MNWKSLLATFTSALTILAVIPYQLGDLGTIIPPNWKGPIVIGGLIATTLLRSINAVVPPPPPMPTITTVTTPPPSTTTTTIKETPNA